MNNSPLIWLDLEMTDLDPKRGTIIEIATMITDSQLNIIEEGPDLVIHQSKAVLESMGDWYQEHFSRSGLLDEIKLSDTTLEIAEKKTLAFIKKHCAPQTGMLAGCSVHVDRLFLYHHMPKVYGYLHHHIIDVDTVKEIASHRYPKLPEFQRAKAHRAHDDIIDSITELKYYLENIFINR